MKVNSIVSDVDNFTVNLKGQQEQNKLALPDKRGGFSRKSRHSSSLNYTVDNQMDNISVNFKKNIFVGKRKSNEKMNRFILDNYSVVSAITKGGTIVNRSNYSNQDSQNYKPKKKKSGNKSQMRQGKNQIQVPGGGISYRSRFKDDSGQVAPEHLQYTPNEPHVLNNMDRQS